MDIYSSDRKLSELSMNLGTPLDLSHPQPIDRLASVESPVSLSSSTVSPFFDNSPTFSMDVLDFFETGFTTKSYTGFGAESSSDDTNQWLEFLNPPLEKIRDFNSVLTLPDNVYLPGEELGYLDHARVKIEDEHSYSKDDELDGFKLNFDGELELFRTPAIDDFADDDVRTKTKLNTIDDLLFDETNCLVDQKEEEEDDDDVGASLVDVSVSDEFKRSAQNFFGQSEFSFQAPPSRENLVEGDKSEFVISLCAIKTEPNDELGQDDLFCTGSLLGSVDAGAMPPTPPSSGCGVNSDSEYSNEAPSGPPSPPASRDHRKQQDHVVANGLKQQSLFSSPIPSSGILVLSEEEKRTLLAEGYSLPSRLPLSKQEEKNLKKIRRKIKNKISAQESRRKKKEYLESLEKKVEQISQENTTLKKRVTLLETNNRSLTSELQRLQALANKVMKSSSSSLSSSSSSSSSSSLKANVGASCIIVK